MPQSGKPRATAAPAQNGSAAAANAGADAERADLLGNTASIFSLGENLSSLAVGFGVGAGEMPDLLASDSGTSISSAPSGGSNKALTSGVHSAPATQVLFCVLVIIVHVCHSHTMSSLVTMSVFMHSSLLSTYKTCWATRSARPVLQLPPPPPPPIRRLTCSSWARRCRWASRRSRARRQLRLAHCSTAFSAEVHTPRVAASARSRTARRRTRSRRSLCSTSAA